MYCISEFHAMGANTAHSQPLLVTESTWPEFICERYSAEQRVFISNTEDTNIYCYCMQDDVMV